MTSAPSGGLPRSDPEEVAIKRAKEAPQLRVEESMSCFIDMA